MKATIIIKGNKISRFQGSAIIVEVSPEPVHIVSNTGVSTDPQAQFVDVQGSTVTIENNVVRGK